MGWLFFLLQPFFSAVRYIAINDNVDTINGESKLAPFLNILNEMHARQTSKKVKTDFAEGIDSVELTNAKVLKLELGNQFATKHCFP